MASIQDLPSELVGQIMDYVVDHDDAYTDPGPILSEWDYSVNYSDSAYYHWRGSNSLSRFNGSPDLYRFATTSKWFLAVYQDWHKLLWKRAVMLHIPAGPGMYELAVRMAVLRYDLKEIIERSNGRNKHYPRVSYNDMAWYLDQYQATDINELLDIDIHEPDIFWTKYGSVLDWCRWPKELEQGSCGSHLLPNFTWPYWISHIPEALRADAWRICLRFGMLVMWEWDDESWPPSYAERQEEVRVINGQFRKLLGGIKRCPVPQVRVVNGEHDKVSAGRIMVPWPCEYLVSLPVSLEVATVVLTCF
jgi:hypothetical protein